VGLLESTSLQVVILARVRMPTLGSSQTPCKQDHTGRCCCCCIDCCSYVRMLLMSTLRRLSCLLIPDASPLVGRV